jgi:hypothetical protein
MCSQRRARKPPPLAWRFTEQNPHDLPSEGQLLENATTVKLNNVQGRWIANNLTAREKEWPLELRDSQALGWDYLE